jgi:hypothetical protein
MLQAGFSVKLLQFSSMDECLGSDSLSWPHLTLFVKYLPFAKAVNIFEESAIELEVPCNPL